MVSAADVAHFDFWGAHWRRQVRHEVVSNGRCAVPKYGQCVMMSVAGPAQQGAQVVALVGKRQVIDRPSVDRRARLQSPQKA